MCFSFVLKFYLYFVINVLGMACSPVAFNVRITNVEIVVGFKLLEISRLMDSLTWIKVRGRGGQGLGMGNLSKEEVIMFCGVNMC